MIYLNNAATSYPKFPEMVSAISSALNDGFVFCNRDAVESTIIPKTIFQLRENISELIHASEPHNIIISTNDTLCLNNIIFGRDYNEKKVIITSDTEHNSVSRPLYVLKEKNKNIKIITIHVHNGIIDFDDLENKIKENKNNINFALFSHASNITGDLINIDRLGKLLFKYNIPFVLDTAQTLGYVNINVEKNKISALTFSGHKGLNGPQGTGGMYLRNTFNINPILFGGTGNSSSSINPPIVYPDSFEVGTPAIHDILGLACSINVLNKKIGFNRYQKKILFNTNYLLNKLKKIDNIIIYGNLNKKKETPIISFNIKGHTCKDIGEILGENNIVSRTGYHCSALGMKSLNVTDFGGTVRLSCGYFNTIHELDFVVDVLSRI